MEHTRLEFCYFNYCVFCIILFYLSNKCTIYINNICFLKHSHVWMFIYHISYICFYFSLYLYINDLPKFVNVKSVPILFADATSILVSHPNPLGFCNNINTVFQTLNDWFRNNLLSLYFVKTHFIRILTNNNNNQTEININYDNKLTPATTFTKFLGLVVNCSLTWTNHIDFLTKKLSSTCYLIWNIKPYLSISALKMVYHSLFHSIMSYGIMFWGNSPHSSIISKMQKRLLRILVGVGYRDSCRELFKELKILTLSSQYIFSLLPSVIQNRGHFASNSAYHDINTRQKNDLHLPHASLTMYQKGVLYSGIKVFNAFPTTIKDISSNPKMFKGTLKHYLLSHSFTAYMNFLVNRILNYCYVYYLIYMLWLFKLHCALYIYCYSLYSNYITVLS
jgi:hypothetical protein